jgi:hypothetical protein
MFFYVSSIFHNSVHNWYRKSSSCTVADKLCPFSFSHIILIFISKSMAMHLLDGSSFLQVHVYHQPWRRIWKCFLISENKHYNIWKRDVHMAKDMWELERCSILPLWAVLTCVLKCFVFILHINFLLCRKFFTWFWIYVCRSYVCWEPPMLGHDVTWSGTSFPTYEEECCWLAYSLTVYISPERQ